VADDRINRLSKRFKTHTAGRSAAKDRNRERRSIYIDMDLMERLDRTHRLVDHELFPQSVSKSAFLEALLEYGLDHLDEIKAGFSST
jgi:serine/threonine protein kinase HipA of HipAB toxin-antitoxin module